MKRRSARRGPAGPRYRQRTERHRSSVLVVLACLVLACAVRPSDAFRPVTVRRIDAAAEGYLHYSLGRLMELEGLYAEALVQYRRAHSLNPGDCELPTAMARVLFAMDRLEDALERARIGRESCPDALEPLVVESDALLLLGRPEEAEETLREALTSREVDLTEPTDAPTRLIVLLGRSLEQQDRMSEAQRLYAAAAAADTLDPELAFLSARASRSLGDNETALRELWRSHRLQPENRAAAATLARLLGLLDRHEEAIPVLEHLVRRGDATTAEYLSVARAYALSGRIPEAHASLDDAMRLWSPTPPLLSARASVHFAAGEVDSAVAVHRRILDAAPEAVGSLNFLAYHYAELGENLDEALSFAERARDASPESPLVLDTLGWTYFRLGRYEDAVRALEAAVASGTEHAVIFEHLGDAYDATGRPERAREAWTRALELDPNRHTTQQRLLGGTQTNRP